MTGGPPEGAWVQHCFLILRRKGSVDAKPECPETETKPAPADVKTVPSDATQTKENESKA